MTTGNKLSTLRREAGYTQEQLAEMLDVSRQAVSKWESDLAYPETEKLIKLGELYGCSMDYLLKDDVQNKNGTTPSESPSPALSFKHWHFEWKSKQTVAGLPLCHVNLGLGQSAKGIVAVGLASKGVLSLGIFSMGAVSFGVFSLGILALGAFSLGLLAAGALAAGLLAFGGVCLGIIAVGGVAMGCFAAGGCAVGKYLAVGDYAFGDIALGVTRMNAYRFGVAPFDKLDLEKAAKLLDQTVPWWLDWAKNMIKPFLSHIF
ncbi:MAG: helix-turn-helix transcriptional regulator [Clostridia bacterium]|nr:helix-turn-helix transcriptional regulator [Clostridia bacterium]